MKCTTAFRLPSQAGAITIWTTISGNDRPNRIPGVTLSVGHPNRTAKVGEWFTRAEASNLFNLVNLDNPGTVLGSKTFGVISTATGNGTSKMRQLQLGLRLTF